MALLGRASWAEGPSKVKTSGASMLAELQRGEERGVASPG